MKPPVTSRSYPLVSLDKNSHRDTTTYRGLEWPLVKCADNDCPISDIEVTNALRYVYTLRTRKTRVCELVDERLGTRS